MTQELTEELLAKSHWLDNSKSYWTEKDLKWAYSLYNRITGQNKKDTGCRSCRKQVVDFLKRKYRDIKNTQNT